MLVLETVPGARVVATPATLDALSARFADRTILRFAADDAVILDVAATAVSPFATRFDADAVVVDEAGFVGCRLTVDELETRVLPHVEWSLPADRPALAQGNLGMVPVKLWLTSGGALLLCPAPYADELTSRLR